MSKHFRVLITNVAWNVTKNQLVDFFSRFGTIIDAKVVYDKATGLSKKHAYITFGDQQTLNKALKFKTHFLEGHFMSIQKENVSEPNLDY